MALFFKSTLTAETAKYAEEREIKDPYVFISFIDVLFSAFSTVS